MRHPFMDAVARRLSERGVATMRYPFPYIERGGRRPDPPRVLISTVRASVEVARQTEPGLPLVAGGKSMGGRITSLAAREERVPAENPVCWVAGRSQPAGTEDSGRSSAALRSGIAFRDAGAGNSAGLAARP